MNRFFIIAPKLLKLLSANFATAMALYPFVLFKNEGALRNKILVNHERIHLRQQLEMLVIPFYLWYGLEYLFRRIQFNSHYVAYRHISFEREAYSNEKKMDYLTKRKFWSFLKYM